MNMNASAYQASLPSSEIGSKHQNLKAPNQEKQQNHPHGLEKEQPKTFVTIDAYSLLQQEFAPLQFAVNEILPHGLFILAGSSKIGKSWLSLDMCRAVATGDAVWKFGAAQGAVLYLALEDNYRRLYNRLKKIGLVVSDEKNTSS